MVHIRPTKGLVVASSSIDLKELLSSCVDACRLGCAEIRAVQRERHVSEGSGILRAHLKDESDPKSVLTKADGAAQTAIVQALVRTWDNQLEIVGEEDEDQNNDDDQGGNARSDGVMLRRDLCQDLNVVSSKQGDGDDDDDDDKDNPLMVPMERVTLFVDPLDGTREFVEERLNNCQTLIGIALGGIPVAGAMGIPFPDGTLHKEPAVVYGLVGVGHGIIGTSPLMKSNTAYNNLPRPLVASGDSTAPVMVAGRQLALLATRTTMIATIDSTSNTDNDTNHNLSNIDKHPTAPGSNVLYGGAGNKLLATAAGHVDAAIQHKFGGPSDTCAPQAVLVAMGGRITTWTGDDVIVTSPDAPSYGCNLGYVATSANSAIDHDKLVALLRDSSVVQDYLEGVKRGRNDVA